MAFKSRVSKLPCYLRIFCLTLRFLCVYIYLYIYQHDVLLSSAVRLAFARILIRTYPIYTSTYMPSCFACSLIHLLWSCQGNRWNVLISDFECESLCVDNLMKLIFIWLHYLFTQIKEYECTYEYKHNSIYNCVSNKVFRSYKCNNYIYGIFEKRVRAAF